MSQPASVRLLAVHGTDGRVRKSITFLQGTLAFASHAPTVKVTDPGAAMEKAQEPGCLRVDTDGYRKAAAQAFHETGELLPGVGAVAEHETFAARFPKEAAAGDSHGTDRKGLRPEG